MSTIPGIPYGPRPKAAQYARALTQWDLIVIHDTGHHGAGGSIASAEAEAGYAANRTDDRSHWTSCHAYIDAGGPVGSLSLDLQAWAAFSWANGRGIHFEMCGENTGEVAAVPAVTVAHTARLVRQVAALKGIPLVKLTPAQLGAASRSGARVRGICGHYDITLGLGVGDHSDPGPRFDWAGFMAQVNGASAQGDEMAGDFSVPGMGDDLCWRMDALESGSETVRGGNRKGEPMWIVTAVKQVAADVAAVKAAQSAPPAVDLDALAEKVAALIAPSVVPIVSGAVRAAVDGATISAPKN